jgi:hypothetical protein
VNDGSGGRFAERRPGRAALLMFLVACAALAALVASTIALRHAFRSPEERAADAEAREAAARETLARDAAAFCRAEIKKRVKPPLVARFEPTEERLGYEPVRGEAYVVGELVTLDRTGVTVRHEYVCRLKRTGADWLALVAAIR